MAAVDLERVGPEAYLARRQVVRVDPDLWVITDHVRGAAPQKTRTVWTFSPDVSIRRGDSAGWYALETVRTGVTARAAFLASSRAVVQEYRGSYAPFAGWHVVHHAPQPASAIVVEQPAGESWLAVVLSLATGTSLGSTEPPRVSRGGGPEDWTLALRTDAGRAELKRRGDQYILTQRNRRGPFTDTLRLTSTPDPASELRAIRTAYEATASLYPRFQEHGPRRQKITYLLVLLILGQELLLFLVRRTLPRWYVSLRIVSVLCWVGVAVWLHYFFLRTWVVVTQ